MAYKFNPFTGKLDESSAGGGGGTPGGSTTQVQFNDAGSFGGDADLTWNKTTNVLGVTGDINLSDGGTYTTTIQCVTPTLTNKTISFPDATGTVALVAGSSGQLLWNNAGANAGASTLTYDGSILTTSGRFINSYNSGSLAPAKQFTGTWVTGQGTTNTKPHVLIEPTGTTSTAWSNSGTGLGVNAASGFTGNLLDLQRNGSRMLSVDYNGYFSKVESLSTVSSTSWINSPGGYYFGNAFDLFIVRDAANTLAQRNGTNAQTFRVYNTYTSSTNYELGKLEWGSNVFRIGTEKGSAGGTARALELQTDGVTRVTIGATSGHLTGSNDVYCAASAFIGCNGRSIFSSPSDGVMRITNYGVNDFNRLQFGGTTASFPSIKRNSTDLQARLADDSGYTTIDAQLRAQGTAPASASATGTAGDIRYDADYIYVCTATDTWKRAALATW